MPLRRDDVSATFTNAAERHINRFTKHSVVDDKVSLSSLLSHEELVQRPPRENNSLTLQLLAVGVTV